MKGKIKRREEARVLYEAARAKGHVAGLLDQERPNIFTQSVANIMPGEKVTVTISYAETLTYTDGAYQLVFPMVVGPRYIPGVPTGQIGGGWAYDTDQVPDASAITPPVTPPGTRAGHDISVIVTVDAGLPLNEIASPSHSISIDNIKPNRALVRLQTGTTIPNKDFILTYNVAGEKIQDTLLTHREGRDGFFYIDSPTTGPGDSRRSHSQRTRLRIGYIWFHVRFPYRKSERDDGARPQGTEPERHL